MLIVYIINPMLHCTVKLYCNVCESGRVFELDSVKQPYKYIFTDEEEKERQEYNWPAGHCQNSWQCDSLQFVQP